MNFLAHLYLSDGHPKLTIGNFIADFVKGRSALQKFELEIVRGIELHRSIDAFTDSHPVVSQSKARLRAKYRHYAGVIVDVFYDHYLSKHWSELHPEPLTDFAQRVYKLIQHYDPILPEEVKRMLPYMIKGNWLVNYAKVEGIHRALTGMSRRTPYLSKMDEAKDELILYYQDFKNEFDIFFPQLKQYCEQKISQWDQART